MILLFVRSMALAALLLHGGGAHADFVQNRGLFPMGEKEALMGNTGIAATGSTGSVYYNPAALLSLPKNRISLSGNSYVSFKTDFLPMDRLDGSDLNFTSSGFQAVPSTFISSRRFENFVGAFSVLVPEQNKLSDVARFETTNFTIDMTQVSQQQFLLAGLSAAAVTENFDIGASCFFGNYESVSESSATLRPKPASGFPNTGFVNSYSSLKMQGILCFGGLIRQISPTWKIGAVVHLPFFPIGSSGRTYSFTQDTSGGTTAPALSEEAPKYQIPGEVGFGNSWVLSGKWTAYLDLTYQMASSYRKLNSDKNDFETQAVFRQNLGFSYAWKDPWNLYFGFGNNPSAAVIKSASDSKEDFKILTAGVDWTEGTASTGVGLYHARSEGVIRLSNGNSGAVRTQATSLVLTSGFNF